MVRMAIDAHVGWRLLRDERTVGADVALVGAAAMKSQVAAELYRALRAGEVTDAEGRRLLTRLAELRVRLLGDRGSRDMAFRLARQLERDELGPLEVLAVGVLQADAIVTDDPLLVSAADGRLRVAAYDELFAG